MSEQLDALKRLEILNGSWTLHVVRTNDPPLETRGRATYAWLPGHFFMITRSEMDDPAFPKGEAIIGCDGVMGTYSMLYSDSRGVARLYSMSLTDDELRLWRDDPSFYQRFIGILSADRNTINGRWERSDDGTTWELDFNITYTKITAAG